MSDEELKRLIDALGGLVQRYHDGLPPRDQFEEEIYEEFRLMDGLIGLVNEGVPLTVPDFVPAEWSEPDS